MKASRSEHINRILETNRQLYMGCTSVELGQWKHMFDVLLVIKELLEAEEASTPRNAALSYTKVTITEVQGDMAEVVDGRIGGMAVATLVDNLYTLQRMVDDIPVEGES